MTDRELTSRDVVADLAAIRDVLAAYMRAIRLRDVDLMDAVFTPQATLDYTAIGGPVSVWADTKPWLATMIAVERFLLYVGDVHVRFGPDGESAEVETTWHGVFVAAPEASPLVVYGSYDDRFVHTPQGWRIDSRVDRPAIQIPVGS